MTTTAHYISVTDPSNSGMQLGSGGALNAQNVNDATTSTTTDLVEVRWTSNSVLAQTVTRKQFLQALDLIKRFVLRGGYGTTGTPDANIPV
jgi:hypothetical protein